MTTLQTTNQKKINRLMYEDFKPGNPSEFFYVAFAKLIREFKKAANLNREYSGRKINFYFLSTGRCGSRLLARVFDLADNAIVFHEPTPHLLKEAFEVSNLYKNQYSLFLNLNIAQFPKLLKKVEESLSFKFEIYGDTLNTMYPFGLMLYHYLGPERLRLVHLIRNPVDCCSSILGMERKWQGVGFSKSRAGSLAYGYTDAEKAANTWIHTNQMIKDQFSEINNDFVCRTFRIEDCTTDSILSFCDFLQLKGINRGQIEKLLSDTTYDIRHSHQARLNQAMENALLEGEGNFIYDKTKKAAKAFGYPELSDHVPSHVQ